MKFLHSLFREFQNRELGQSKMHEMKIKSWSKQTEFFFSVEKDRNMVEEVQRPKTTPDVPKSVIPNRKIRVFIPHESISKFFLIFFFFFRQESRLHTNTVENHSQNTP